MSSSEVQLAPLNNVNPVFNVLSVLRTLYVFLIRENMLTWWALQGKRNPRADMEGPFYLIGAPNRNIGPGKGVLASIADLKEFSPFILKIAVQDPKGEPIPNAHLDIWQATTAGDYFFKTYRLRGQFTTDDNGELEVLSIPPGKYGPPGLLRAGHFHVILSDGKGKYENLTTQIYVCEGNAVAELEGDFTNFMRAHRPPNMLASWSIPSATNGTPLLGLPELESDDADVRKSVDWWNKQLAQVDEAFRVAGGGQTVFKMNEPPFLGIF